MPVPTPKRKITGTSTRQINCKRVKKAIWLDGSCPESIKWFIENQAFSLSFYSATPSSPSSTSISSTSETQDDWERETTCWWEKGGGRTTAGKPGPLLIIQYSLLLPVLLCLADGLWVGLLAQWGDFYQVTHSFLLQGKYYGKLY